MNNTNTQRRLNWLWKHRHTHDDDNETEQLTVLVSEVQHQMDSAGQGETGAFLHLVRTTTQSIADGGEPIEFTGIGTLGFFGFSSPGIADDGTTSDGSPTPGTDIVIPVSGAYWDIEFGWEWDTFEGGGRCWLTRNGATVWPPAGMPTGVFESDDGQVFEPEVAKGIFCDAGDVLQVWVDPQDASAQDLARAFVNVELVDRGGLVTSCPVLASPITAVDTATKHNGFPGYVVADDGTRIIAYREGTGHASFDGIIRVIRSTDGGDTWSAPVTVFSNGAYDAREGILTPLADGRIVMAVGVQSSVDGSGVADGGFTLISSDAGATWSTPAQIDDGGFTGWGLITGNLLELANGDWLLAITGKDASTSRRIRVIKSADDGATWTVAATEVADADDFGDPNFAEANMIRSGSTIVMMFRDNDGPAGLGGLGYKMWRLVSQDDGTTWTAPALVLTGQGASPRMLLRANGDVLVLLRDVQSGTVYPPQLWRSTDLCQSWSKCELFAGDKFAYGQLAEDADNKVGVAYSIETDNGSTGDATVYFRKEP